MRTFKKDDRVLRTSDNIIAEAILNSGYVEIETVEKPIEEKPKKAKKKGE